MTIYMRVRMSSTTKGIEVSHILNIRELEFIITEIKK